MSLFDLIKNVGGKVWSNGKKTTGDKNSLLQKHIASLGLPGTKNIEFTLDKQDNITASGTVVDQKTKNIIIAELGNIEGVSGVNDNLHIEPSSVGTHFYIVASGDSLSTIARHIYADSSKYMVIFEANQPMLSHPDKIYPGQKLIIPAIQD
ncbi:peptidoglycan-binding protein LysM [Rahnella bruchi]|uniref:peptidoglycan-binding protein LysM n=1 Tax=Rahnella bruchi TaxID=1510573 RepID=UPI0013C4B25C|nr:peptidoglycan-binding protein LysM [Rahnella bruchi]